MSYQPDSNSNSDTSDQDSDLSEYYVDDMADYARRMGSGSVDYVDRRNQRFAERMTEYQPRVPMFRPIFPHVFQTPQTPLIQSTSSIQYSPSIVGTQDVSVGQTGVPSQLPLFELSPPFPSLPSQTSQPPIDLQHASTSAVTTSGQKSVSKTKKVNRLQEAKEEFIKCYLNYIETNVECSTETNSGHEGTNETKISKWNSLCSDDRWFDSRILDQDNITMEELLSMVNVVNHLKDGGKFLVNCYVNNMCVVLNNDRLIKAYAAFPSFVRLISNQDILDLINRFDTLSNQQIIDDPSFYKMELFTTKLTDLQLQRLMTIYKQHNCYPLYTRMLEFDKRYEIIASDILMLHNDSIDYYNFPSEFKTYVLKHDKVPDIILYDDLSDFTDIEIQYYSNIRLLQILCVDDQKYMYDDKDSNYPTKVIRHLEDTMTCDDVSFMRKKRLWKLYIYFPKYTFELAKRFEGETNKQHYLRLNTMLPIAINYNDIKNKLVPIKDENNECYVLQEPIHLCQKYHTCKNGHCISASGFQGMPSKVCGMCRSNIYLDYLINLSVDDFDTLFI